MAAQDPCQIDAEHILVRSLKEASQKTLHRYMLKGSEGATVMTLFQKHKIPAVATGFGSSRCCHVTNEYVAIPNLFFGYQMLKNFLILFDKYVTI
ncbi:hypothetical protein ACFL96_04840 [Thermoproteota archaeon]